MLPSLTHVFGERNFIFQDDNCRVNRARVVREFLDEQGVRTLPWSSKSPDLNPIENIWGRMTSIYIQGGPDITCQKKSSNR
jgi:transposase